LCASHIDPLPDASESNRPLDRVLLSIDAGLQQYGSSVAQVIYFRLEKLYGLKKEEIPKKPEIFVQLLDEFFGVVGAGIVKRSILRELERNSGVKDLMKKQLSVALKEVWRYWLREDGYSSGTGRED
jgi:hypothetical protein